jgi:hypothetical protein
LVSTLQVSTANEICRKPGQWHKSHS